MKQFNLSNGDQMPAIGLGTWKSAEGEVYDAIRNAIKIGYRHFDCAHIYGNEKEIGQALADAILAKEVTREELWITSKLWNNSHRPEQVYGALKNTLSNLQLTYLDLYLIHWPVALKDDCLFPSSSSDLIDLKQAPLENTWKGMIETLNIGLSRHIGVSNFSPKKIDTLIAHTGVAPEVNQVEMHPFLQQSELKTYCDNKNIILTAYSPLGSGDRPANRIKVDEPKLFQNEELGKIAKALNCSSAQIMLSWAVNRNTAVIPKSVNKQRLKENLEASKIKLSEINMNTIANLNINYRYIKGDFWCIEGSGYTLENLWDEDLSN